MIYILPCFKSIRTSFDSGDSLTYFINLHPLWTNANPGSSQAVNFPFLEAVEVQVVGGGRRGHVLNVVHLGLHLGHTVQI